MHAISLRLALLLLMLPFATWAQDFDCAAIDAPPIAVAVAHRDRLNALEQNGCLGGDHDSDRLTHEVMDMLPDGRAPHSPGVSDEERRAATLRALDKLGAAVEAQIAALPMPEPVGAVDRLRTLRNAISAAKDDVATGRVDEGLHRPAYWKFDRNSGGFNQVPDVRLRVAIQLYQGFIDDACRERDNAACAETYATGKHILRDAHLVERTLTYYASPIIDMNYREAVKRDRQWSAYFDEALFQYPWELFLNGLWLDKHDERPRDTAGNRLGFRTPPHAQWIVFHPNVGFEYIGGAADGNQFEPTVFVEIIGYNRWRWNAAGEIKNALGLSIITSYSDRAGVDDIGYGLQLHYHNSWSLAVTRHGSDTGLLLSTDLAQYLGEVSTKARQVMRFGQ